MAFELKLTHYAEPILVDNDRAAKYKWYFNYKNYQIYSKGFSSLRQFLLPSAKNCRIFNINGDYMDNRMCNLTYGSRNVGPRRLSYPRRFLGTINYGDKYLVCYCKDNCWYKIGKASTEVRAAQMYNEYIIKNELFHHINEQGRLIYRLNTVRGGFEEREINEFEKMISKSVQ